jgi:hypothetical protein
MLLPLPAFSSFPTLPSLQSFQSLSGYFDFHTWDQPSLVQLPEYVYLFVVVDQKRLRYPEPPRGCFKIFERLFSGSFASLSLLSRLISSSLSISMFISFIATISLLNTTSNSFSVSALSHRMKYTSLLVQLLALRSALS